MNQQEQESAFEALIDGLIRLENELGYQGGTWDDAMKLIHVAAETLLEQRTADGLQTAIVKLQEQLIAKAIAERDHWRSNHDAQVTRARILRDRPDMPLERVRAYDDMRELQQHLVQLTDSNAALQDMLAEARIDLELLRDRLGVSPEPHQTLFERMLDAARTVGVRS